MIDNDQKEIISVKFINKSQQCYEKERFAKLQLLSNKDKIEYIYEISFPGAQKISLPDCRTVQTCFGQIIEIRCSRGILKTRLNFDTADTWLEPAFIYFKSQTESMSMSV